MRIASKRSRIGKFCLVLLVAKASLFGGLTAPSAVRADEPSLHYIVNEPFDQQPTPEGWTFDENDPQELGNTIRIADETLELKSASSGAQPKARRQFAAQSGKIEVEFRMARDSGTERAQTAVSIANGAGTGSAVQFRWFGDKFEARTGDSVNPSQNPDFQTLTTAAYGQWVKVRVELDIEQQQLNLYVGDESTPVFADHAFLHPCSDIAQLYVGGPNKIWSVASEASVYIDDVVVHTAQAVIVNEPFNQVAPEAWEVGSYTSIEDSSLHTLSYAERRFAASRGLVYFDTRVKVMEGGRMSVYADDAANPILTLTFRTDGRIEHRVTGEDKRRFNYTKAAWIAIKLRLDLTNDTFDIWTDGVLRGSGWPFSNHDPADNVARIRYAAESEAIDIDYLQVYRNSDEAVAADRQWLNLDYSSSITGDFDLPIEGPNGSLIAWTSSHPSVVAIPSVTEVDRNSGFITAAVTRPDVGQADIEATLTAAVSDGAVTNNQSFPVTVLRAYNDVEAVAADVDWLDLGNLDRVTTNVPLPTQGPNGTTISWQSSDTATISTIGTVTRPAEHEADAGVTLTATVGKGAATDTKQFQAAVIRQYPAFTQDTSGFSDEEFFGVWNGGQAKWTTVGKINYFEDETKGWTYELNDPGEIGNAILITDDIGSLALTRAEEAAGQPSASRYYEAQTGKFEVEFSTSRDSGVERAQDAVTIGSEGFGDAVRFRWFGSDFQVYTGNSINSLSQPDFQTVATPAYGESIQVRAVIDVPLQKLDIYIGDGQTPVFEQHDFYGSMAQLSRIKVKGANRVWSTAEEGTVYVEDIAVTTRTIDWTVEPNDPGQLGNAIEIADERDALALKRVKDAGQPTAIGRFGSVAQLAEIEFATRKDAGVERSQDVAAIRSEGGGATAIKFRWFGNNLQAHTGDTRNGSNQPDYVTIATAANGVDVHVKTVIDVAQQKLDVYVDHAQSPVLSQHGLMNVVAEVAELRLGGASKLWSTAAEGTIHVSGIVVNSRRDIPYHRNFADGLADVGQAVTQGDYASAKAHLYSYYQERGFGDFSLGSTRDPRLAQLYIDQIWSYSQREKVIGTLQVADVEQTAMIDVTEEMSLRRTDAFMLMARAKEPWTAVFDSREGAHPPTLEMIVNGQPVVFTAVNDTYVRAGKYGNRNYGEDSSIRVRDSGAPVDDDNMRGYIKFDLSSVGAADAITSAVLKLHGSTDAATGTKDILVFNAGRKVWDETDMTWNNTKHMTFSYNGLSGGFDYVSQPYADEQWFAWSIRSYWLEPIINEYLYTSDDAYAYHAIELTLNQIAHGYGGANRTMISLIDHEYMNPTVFTAMLKSIWNEARYEYEERQRRVDNRGIILPTLLLMFPEFADTDAWWQELEENTNMLLDDETGLLLPDGSYLEGSNHYIIHVINGLLAVRDGFAQVNRPIPAGLDAKVESLVKYWMDASDPAGQVSEWGDGTNNGGHYSQGVILNAGNRFDNEEFRYYGSAGAQGTEPSYTSVYYPYGRIANMRSGWSEDALYAFMNMRTGGFHSHPDAHHISVYAYGRRLLTDAGVTSYDNNDPIAYWQKNTTRAHNSIEINDTPQVFTFQNALELQPPSAGTMATNGLYDFVEGWHEANYEVTDTFRHNRSVLFVKPHYWIVSDYVEAPPGVHKYNQTWHMHPDAQISMDGTTKAAQSNYASGANITVVPADPQKLGASLADGFDYGRESRYLSYVQIAEGNVSFDTVLFPNEEGPAADVTVHSLPLDVDRNAATALEIDLEDHKGYYYLSREQVPIIRDFAAYRTDGRLAYVEQAANGNPVLAVVHGGSSLTRGEVDIVASGFLIDNLGVRWNGSVVELSSSTLQAGSLSGLQIYAPDPVSAVTLNGQPISFNQAGDYISF